MSTIDLGDVRLAVNDTGPGAGAQPVLFVHGMFMSRRVWSAVLAHCDTACIRGVAIDLRGAGESSQPSSGYSLDQHVLDIVRVADALEIDTFTYVGLSMGGRIGMQLALTHPDRLRAMMLISPGPSNGIASFDPPATAEQYIAFIRAARLDHALAPMAATLTFGGTPTSEQAELLTEDLLRCSDGFVNGSWDSAMLTDISGRLGEITVPTLVVAGDQDMLLPQALADRSRINSAGLHVFHGIGHYSPLQIPEQIADLLEAFMAELPTQT